MLYKVNKMNLYKIQKSAQDEQRPLDKQGKYLL